MKRMLSMTLAMAFILLAGGMAQAQDPPNPPSPERRGEAVKKILDLTDQQLQQLLDLQVSQRTNNRELMSQMRELQKQMRELMKSENPDPAQLGALALQRRELQEKIKADHDALHDQALALLTTAQKEKVEQIQKAVELARQARPLAGLGLFEAPEGGPDGPGPMGLMGQGQGFRPGSGPGPGPGGPRGPRNGGQPGRPGPPPVN
ncbi:MAG: hypothetical protein A3F68_06890 [Acidobacteria bacterium RIFCSPLOWO2_12_FULL_54_10]|nr:MAG: hypothetical protein A3F68_06890 [Acidobacteria bacterium RIFCSPLOWO2_12_FULL_54_10]